MFSTCPPLPIHIRSIRIRIRQILITYKKTSICVLNEICILLSSNLGVNRRFLFVQRHNKRTMSAFSDQTFKASDYNSFRPTYDTKVFDEILKYHQGGDELAVDIGCGSGQASYPLTEHFKKVIGTDLSQPMVDTANGRITEKFKGKIEFRQSPAETLSFIEDNSVDLVTAAQCIHWFDHPKFFNEINRILKPNGTLAFWGYADPIFGIPEADEFADQFTYEDETKLGPFWEQPGRQILRNLLADVNPPQDKFGHLKTYEHRPGMSDGSSPIQIKRDMTLENYGKYVKTWSSYHNWQKANPGKPDIADHYINELQARFKWTPKTIVHLEWLTVLKLARKL